jgi:hypothetical protein
MERINRTDRVSSALEHKDSGFLYMIAVEQSAQRLAGV